jgi:hypothetical protein
MASALELQFRVHYKALEQESGPWTGDRIRKLCRLLRLSVPELARLIRVNPHALRSGAVMETIPSHIRLLLDLVERSAHGKYLGKTYSQPLIPPI